MLEMKDIPTHRLIRSLASTTCPACGRNKGRSKTLCYSDFCRLPARMKAATYNRVGSGYEEAVLAALQFLRVETFTDEVRVIR
jgi:hypothetical protein